MRRQRPLDVKLWLRFHHPARRHIGRSGDPGECARASRAYCAYRPPTPPPIVPAPQPAPAPAIASEPASQWTRIQTQVTAPSEGGLGGVIAEGWFSVVGGELRVEDGRGR